ncbi:NAD(P)-binding protein [Sistotremastrum niveocremeum HHB9708]|uniref:NAD(P)-binding protein n=1 Tax=Sistotremastrum niveocremeum HHB9708 TaxID=1314777 RepID=A0A164TD35_9AGAM|nr:NAD(P)-binding protein [Sistotremastrum niveocremeum HHB9708]
MKTIAIAGAGDLAKFVVEALEEAGAYTCKIVVISRARREWFATRKSIEIRITDYTLKSLKPLLVDVDVLFSCLHDNTSFYVQGHNALLQACISSPRCKRFVPSEYGGDIDKFPCIPRFYKDTHCAFREILRSKDHGVEWTLVNAGYFMDYFLPPEKTHMKPLPTVWPIGDKKATIPGFGNEPIGFTLARDVARGLIKLIEAPKWDEHIYMCAEITTWNDILDRMRSLGIKSKQSASFFIS